MIRLYQFISILFIFACTSGYAQHAASNGIQLDTLANFRSGYDSINYSTHIGYTVTDSVKTVKGYIDDRFGSVDTLNNTLHGTTINIAGKISSIDTIGVSKNVQRIKNRIDSLNTQLGGKLQESNLDINGNLGTVEVPAIPTSNLKLPEDENLSSSVSIPGNDQSVAANPISVSIAGNDVNDIVEKSHSYSGSIDSMKNVKPEKLDAIAEKKVMQLNEVKNLQEGVDQIEMQKELIEQYKQQLKFEAELKEKAKEVASDVIVQYQTKVQEQMPNLNKYKRKFNFVQDLRNLPKRAPNSVKDLKWRERVIPGLTFYSMNSTELWLQFDPQVVYRLTGNLSAGLGGMYRFSMNNKKFTFSDFENLYGVKIVSSYKIYKGFFIQAEGHRVTYKPWEARLNDPNYKTTVYAVVGGIGMSHAISRQLKGNIQALYHYAFGEDPYRPKVMLKFGMDFSLVKREKPQWELTLKSLRKCK